MAKPVEIKNGLLEMLLVTDEEVNADTPIVQSLYQVLKGFNEIVAVKDISFVRDVGDPMFYNFRVELKDTCIADITLLFTDSEDVEPVATVSIPNAWAMGALNLIVVKLSRVLIDMRAKAGVESFTVVFI